MKKSDKVASHNETRNTVYRQGQGAGARPELEKSGLLSGLGWPGVAGHRPADTLLCSTAGVRTGKRRTRLRVALDIGIVCPQAHSHIGAGAGKVLGAASEYVNTKCKHQDTEKKCEEAGIEYQPMIFESFGGIESEAEEVLKSLSRLVADNTRTPYGEVAQRLWQRISVDLQRAGHRAFARRVGGGGIGVRSGAEGVLEATEGLEWIGAGGAPIG